MPANFTSDIHVVTDAQFKLYPIPQPLNDSDGFGTSTLAEAGISKPEVILNNTKISPERIYAMFLDFRGTYPEGWIEVYDSDNTVHRFDNPGANNRILVSILPGTNDTYRKIKIPGYITDVYRYDDVYRYYFEYKYMPLEVPYVKSWKATNTFNFFNNIAKEIGLGFAVGENVENIEDIRPRFCTGLPLKYFLEQQMTFAGVDEDSVMDFWVDPWGYMNIVNLSHQISQVDQNMKVSVTVGSMQEVGDIPETVKGDVESARVITNLDLEIRNNLQILDYQDVTDNTSTAWAGNDFIDYTLNVQGGMSLTDTTAVVTQNRIGGITADSQDIDNFSFGTMRYRGTEMCELPILKQETNRQKLMRKLNGSHTEFIMDRPNFGLTRGLQVGALIVNYSHVSRQYNVDANPEDFMDNDAMPTPDMYHSGIYYINGVTYEYNQGMECISQKLYAVRLSQTLPPSVYSKNEDGTYNVDESALNLVSCSFDSGAGKLE